MMLSIAWRTVRRQPGTLVGAFVMITVGASLLSAFSIVQGSISQTRAPVERYEAAPIVAGGDSGLFTPEMVERVGEVPGVAEAIPELTFPATMLGGDGAPVASQEEIAQFGHAWTSADLTPFALDRGEAPVRDDDVVMDRSLAANAGVDVGDRVEILVAGVVREYRLAGTAEPEKGESSLDHQHALFFTPERATELAGRGDGRVDGIGVIPHQGAGTEATTSAIRDAVEGELEGSVPSPAGGQTLRVATGLDRGELEESLPDHRASGQVMATLVWIVAFMVVVVVSGALITSVRRRAREFALLRAIGATPGQIRRLCLAEALVLSAAAATAGGALGVLLAWVLLEGFRSLGLVSSAVALSYGTGPIAIAAGTTVLVAQVAAWLTARSALRIRPGEALTATSTRRSRRGGTTIRVTLGLLSLGGAGTIQALGMAGQMPPALRDAYGMIASGLIMVGVSLLGAWAIFSIARVTRLLVARLPRVSGHLAAANVRFQHRRYAGVAAPLAVGVAIAGWALSGLPLFALGNAEDLSERFDADYFLRTPIVRDAPLGLDEEVRQGVLQLSGVSATAGVSEVWAHAQLDADTGGPVPENEVTRSTVVSGDASELLDLRTSRGKLESVDTGDGIAVGSTYARQQGVDLGDRVRVRLAGATQPVHLPVVALFDRDEGGGQGLVIPHEAVTDTMADLRHDYILAKSGPESGQETAEELRTLAGPAEYTRIEDREGFVEGYVQERQNAIDNLGTIATVLVGVFLIIAAVNALALTAADRKAELNALRQLNLTPGQTKRMVTWEMALTVGPAWLLGVAATMWMALAMAGGDIGAVIWAFPGYVLAILGAFGLGCAVLGSLAATRSVLRALQR